MKIQTTKWLTFFILLICFKVTYAGSSFPKLEAYVNQGNYKLAYQQAVKLRAKNEGDPRFDYLYGLSALQTGHYNEAVFALDRVTVATPNVIRPRLELARTYLKLNNKTAAVKEFNDVLKLSPPPIVEQKVGVYLAELKKANKQAQRSITKRLASFSIGYDDNINFGIANSDIDLPGLGQVTLDPSAVKQKSGFAEARFQLRHRKILSKKTNTFLMANLTHREYFKNTDFNYLFIDLRAGITFNKAKSQYQFVVRDTPVFLDGELHSNTLGLDAMVRKSLGAGKVISTSLSLESYDNKKFSSSDRQRALIGLRLDKTSGALQHQFNAQIGTEWPEDKEGKQFSRNISGIGYKVTREWNTKNKSFLNLDYHHYKHQAAYPIFPDSRSDDRFIIKAVHERKINDKLAILFSVRHINNNSNLALYDTQRNEVKIGLRYDWD